MVNENFQLFASGFVDEDGNVGYQNLDDLCWTVLFNITSEEDIEEGYLDEYAWVYSDNLKLELAYNKKGNPKNCGD